MSDTGIIRTVGNCDLRLVVLTGIKVNNYWQHHCCQGLRSACCENKWMPKTVENKVLSVEATQTYLFKLNARQKDELSAWNQALCLKHGRIRNSLTHEQHQMSMSMSGSMLQCSRMSKRIPGLHVHFPLRTAMSHSQIRKDVSCLNSTEIYILKYKRKLPQA